MSLTCYELFGNILIVVDFIFEATSARELSSMITDFETPYLEPQGQLRPTDQLSDGSARHVGAEIEFLRHQTERLDGVVDQETLEPAQLGPHRVPGSGGPASVCATSSDHRRRLRVQRL